uniref:Histidine kinase domain-containing protein n=1 Tax=Aureoumbra lagunensis TaxID=44058 RepID=A0A7S3JYM5_9STRA|mmetsp:Transcript_3407/g.4767  ORF Transcript_3407/g.4767 Transcript_3407/m.4767 type:complete len:661 (-) Transcript_3407:284-2266(-)
MNQRIKISSFFLILIAVSAGLALWFGLTTTTTKEELFKICDAVGVFHSDFVREAADARRKQNVVTITDSEETLKEIVFHVEGMREAIIKLEDIYKKGKRRVPILKKVKKKFKSVVLAAYSSHGLAIDLIEVASKWPVMSLEEYLLLIDQIDRENIRASRSVMLPRILRLRKSLKKLSNESTSTAFITAAITTLVAASVCILFLLIHVSRENVLEIEAQNKLARQQAHEQMNSLSPALSLIEAVLEIDTAKELKELKPDLQMAHSLLRQVEEQHATRLSCYKLMRGRYRLQMDTFDLNAFMRDQISNEEAIAKAKDPHNNILFQTEIIPTNHQIYIRCDPYILQHITRNFLSNSRKYTTQGHIKFSFLGEKVHAKNTLLLFRIQDTGHGIAEDIAKRLFTTEITTGGNNGNGLGLPSCAIFCRAANGYAKLIDTKLADDAGNGGFSIFEFCIAGTICTKKATNHSPRSINNEDAFSQSSSSLTRSLHTQLPNCLCIAIVDDSYVNRRVLQMRLEKVASDSGCTNWSFFQFSTVEAAQPHLRENKSEFNLVTLDNDLSACGGRKSGTDAIQYLKSIQYKGMIVSCSGDAEISHVHLELGANCAWGKPLPSLEFMKIDLVRHFQPTSSSLFADSSKLNNHQEEYDRKFDNNEEDSECGPLNNI